MLTTLFALAALGLPPAGHAPGSATEAAGAPLLAVQDEELPDERPEIAEMIDRFDDLIGERGEKDAEAITVIDQLLQEYPKSGPKDRDDIVDALGGALEERRQELEEGVPDNRLYIASAVALGEMGEPAAKTIAKYIGHKRHRDDLQLQRQLVLSLGKTKSEKHADDLADLLVHKDAILVAAAAEAMANYADSEQKLRKDLTEEIIKVLMTVKGRMDSDANDIEARQRYDAIAAPMVTSLQTLTGHDERVPEEWQRWWNKNKKEDWDRERSS